MPSSLYVHVGTHKTGSTAIQRALADKQQHLQFEGYRYLPITPSAGNRLMRATCVDRTLVKSLQGQILKAVRTAQKDSGGRRDTYILSWEGFCGSPDIGYLNAAHVAEILRASTRRFDTHIVLYLRRQDTFVESMYMQTIQQGDSLSFQEFLGKFKDPASLDYERILDSFSGLFGQENVVARSYDKAREGDGLIKDFGRVLGSRTLQTFALKSPCNVSYSRTALAIARASNPRLDAAQQQRLRWILQASSPINQDSSFQLFEHEQRAEMLARFAASNSRVATRIMPPGDQSLFHSPDYKTGNFGNLCLVSPDDVAPIVAYLVSQLTTATDGAAGKVSKSQKLLRELERMVKKLKSLVRRRAA